MKKFILLLVGVLSLAVQSASAQSSWYNPNHRNTTNRNTTNQNTQSYSSWYNPSGNNNSVQNSSQNNDAPYLEYRSYNYTFSDGSTFKGQAELHKGVVARYNGSIKYTNGDLVIGSWTTSWVPVYNHDHYRASDSTHWVYSYDQNGNKTHSHQVIDVPADGYVQPSGQSGYNSSSSSSGPSYNRHEATCRGCNGSGRCQHCYGTGLVNNNRSKCSLCHGTGRCQSCAGTGKIHGSF